MRFVEVTTKIDATNNILYCLIEIFKGLLYELTREWCSKDVHVRPRFSLGIGPKTIRINSHVTNARPEKPGLGLRLTMGPAHSWPRLRPSERYGARHKEWQNRHSDELAGSVR